VQVHNFANQLATFGHSVAVALPWGDDTGGHLGEQKYTVRYFSQIEGEWSRIFSNGASPDVVHAWTPRENVRLFCEKLAAHCNFSLVIHLEDNEELILEANLGTSFEKLARSNSIEVPKNLSHPRRYRGFIASAAGVTLIMDRLAKFVPEEVPKLILWPGADRDLFFPRPVDEPFLRQIGVPPGAIVLCYTGNVHSANAREVRSLYVAAAILDREGLPARLVRAGRDFCPFLGEDTQWARNISIELGYVKHVEIPKVLAIADFLVQPGSDDAFNEYRLPAKLPEFFAMGRPVILPRTNAGRFVKYGEEGWVLSKVDALGIAEAVQTLIRDKPLARQLSVGAGTFCDEHFSWKKNARALETFYGAVARRAAPRPTPIEAAT
jgi:glycosyltransferase involved in cell wall biosynthesis